MVYPYWDCLTPRTTLPRGERESNGEKRLALINATQGFYLGRWRSHQFLTPTCYIFLRYPLKDRNVLPVANLALTYLGGEEGGDCLQFWAQDPIRLKSLVRVNVSCTPMSATYILTLEGTDNNFYEAKVLVVFKDMWRPNPKTMIVLLMRPAVYYPEIDQEVLREFDAPDELAYESADSDEEPDAPDEDDGGATNEDADEDKDGDDSYEDDEYDDDEHDGDDGDECDECDDGDEDEDDEDDDEDDDDDDDEDDDTDEDTTSTTWSFLSDSSTTYK